MARAGDLMGISLYDHIIVSRRGFVSLKERGCCDEERRRGRAPRGDGNVVDFAPRRSVRRLLLPGCAMTKRVSKTPPAFPPAHEQLEYVRKGAVEIIREESSREAAPLHRDGVR